MYTIPEELAHRIVKLNDCWIYQGERDNLGQGIYHYRDRYYVKRNTRVHRYTWKKCLKKDLHPNTKLLNQCGNSGCCNPMHWKLGVVATPKALKLGATQMTVFLKPREKIATQYGNLPVENWLYLETERISRNPKLRAEVRRDSQTHYIALFVKELA